MSFFPCFISVVFALRNQSEKLIKTLTETSNFLSSVVSDYELIIIDNASRDESLTLLKELTSENGLPNLQVYALTKEVDMNTASWVGIENALGDFVISMDPLAEDISFLPTMIEKAIQGADVVFANNKLKPAQNFTYSIASSVFNFIYQYFNGVHLTTEAPNYRLLNKRVINFILKHPQPHILYRSLPAIAGFVRVNLNYSAKPQICTPKHVGESLDRGIQLLVSTSHAPMRVVASLSLFGAVINCIYSLYVVALRIFKSDVAPGWASLSLQLSGMFFLISLVLFVLSEYLIHLENMFNVRPSYHISQEFISTHMNHHKKLNVEG